jgi:hypothetical protein
METWPDELPTQWQGSTAPGVSYAQSTDAWEGNIACLIEDQSPADAALLEQQDLAEGVAEYRLTDRPFSCRPHFRVQAPAYHGGWRCGDGRKHQRADFHTQYECPAERMHYECVATAVCAECSAALRSAWQGARCARCGGGFEVERDRK